VSVVQKINGIAKRVKSGDGCVADLSDLCVLQVVEDVRGVFVAGEINYIEIV